MTLPAHPAPGGYFVLYSAPRNSAISSLIRLIDVLMREMRTCRSS